jgi:hypothetical protein
MTCLRSGWCCKLTPCNFGVALGSPKLEACIFLGGDKPGEYFCTKYDYIISQEGWEDNPSFGKGCSSLLNPDRQRLLNEDK